MSSAPLWLNSDMPELLEFEEPIGEGAIDAGHIRADLTDLARGAVLRTDPSDITVFKSVGIAVEDLAAARLVYDAVRARDDERE